MDLLLAAVILSIIAVAVTLSSVTISRTSESIFASSIASQLANDKLEELALIDPKLLDATYSTMELEVKSQGHTFQRQVVVMVNSDGSRHVEITVKPTRVPRAVTIRLSHSFALWGSQ
jgi:hypothetical protein